MSLRLCKYLEDEGLDALVLEYPRKRNEGTGWVLRCPARKLRDLGLEPGDFFSIDDEWNIVRRDPATEPSPSEGPAEFGDRDLETLKRRLNTLVSGDDGHGD